MTTIDNPYINAWNLSSPAGKETYSHRDHRKQHTASAGPQARQKNAKEKKPQSDFPYTS